MDFLYSIVYLLFSAIFTIIILIYFLNMIFPDFLMFIATIYQNKDTILTSLQLAEGGISGDNINNKYIRNYILARNHISDYWTYIKSLFSFKIVNKAPQ